jgi:hypothetical protein
LFWCPKGLVEECLHLVKEEMEKPSEVMLMPWQGNEGLAVEVEAKLGDNWGR